ncbi:sulfatase-like hydrolase/transferase, partial [bacterium]|nr:sulfatase-like hydrolase/transferase [bacterium]
LLDVLDELKLAKNTFVIYTTDNGPWLTFKHHGGSAGPLRDGKGTTFEGGQRVPCLIRGPGVPANTVCEELTGTIDVLPTIAAITNSTLPKENKIDGFNVSGLWMGTEAGKKRNEFVHYTSRGVVEGLRQGDWKLLVKGQPNARNPKRNKAKGNKPKFLLFNLREDVGEKNNLADQHPEIVKRLLERMREIDKEITTNARSPWFKAKNQ